MQLLRWDVEIFYTIHSASPVSALYSMNRFYNVESTKGGWISEKFPLCIKSPKKKVPNHSPEHFFVSFFQARGLAQFFLDIWAKVKKLFAVKLPLLVILFLMVISELTTKQEELIKIITIQKVLVMFEDGFSKDCLLFESFKQGISSLKITEWSCNMALWKTIQIDWIFSLLKKKHTKNHPQSSKIYIEHACNIAWQV